VTETLPQDTRTPQVQVFRGALDAGARKITQQMMVAAAEAIFSVVGDDLAPDRIVPSPLDPRVCPAVAEAVAGASGV
jgi:malate dehydrogenase (oxaloacetate-decarboxylating)